MKNNKKRRKSRIFKGTAVSTGIAIGKPYLLGSVFVDFPKYWIHSGEVKGEIKRFYKALDNLKNQLDQVKSKLCHIQGKEPMNILDSHILLLKDELLIKNAVSAIEREHINVEWAVHKTIQEITQAFARISQAYFRERQYDLNFIEKALLRNLMGQEQDLFEKVPKGSIIVAHDISPAETLHLIRCKGLGFITEVGGLNSHTAIVARALKIPAIVGVEGLSQLINEKDLLLLDGEKGLVLVNPPPTKLKKYEQIQETQKISEKMMKKEAQLEARTKDGHLFEILANVEFTDEIELVKEYGANGIGLYRTEFLFLDKEAIPDVKTQETIYRKVLKKMAPKEVIIRTIDLGADKLGSHISHLEQLNPALGLRAIRFSLQEIKLFTDQLRALFMASPAGKLKICFPMISSTDELRQVKKIISGLLEQLKKEKVSVAPNIPLGVMIETPSAVMEMDLLALEADFFSIGTNDLIQYLLAVDRTNELVSFLYHPFHPSVIRTLKQITDTAHAFGKEVTLCGEMAGDPLYLFLLIALGFNRLSMNPASIPKVKKILRQTSLEQAQALLKQILASSSYKDNRRMIRQKMNELFPEYFS